MNTKPIRKLIFAMGFAAMAFSATAVAVEYPDMIAGEWNFTGDQTGSITFTGAGGQYIGMVSGPVEMLGCTHAKPEMLFQASFLTSEYNPSEEEEVQGEEGQAYVSWSIYAGLQKWYDLECEKSGGGYGSAVFSVIQAQDGSAARLVVVSTYQEGYSVAVLEKASDDSTDGIAAVRPLQYR